MSESSPDTIITRFDDTGGQWLAYFAGTPQVAFGSDLPLRAIRRLLEETEASPEGYSLRCGSDPVGSPVPQPALIWDPPEILFECASCRGTGQYVGLREVGPCEVCRGRKVVAG